MLTAILLTLTCDAPAHGPHSGRTRPERRPVLVALTVAAFACVVVASAACTFLL